MVTRVVPRPAAAGYNRWLMRPALLKLLLHWGLTKFVEMASDQA